MGNLFGGGGRGGDYTPQVVNHHHYHTVTVPDPETEKKNKEQKEELVKQASLIEELKKKVEENEIKNPNDYIQQSENSFNKLCEIASTVPATNLINYKDFVCVAFYGEISSGKSSCINLLMESKVAEVGPGEVTKNITPYIAPHGKFCFYDYPGNSEQITYYSANALSMARGMDASCVLVTATIKTNLRYCRLLESMGSPFVVLLTQVDLSKWTKESIQQVKQSINDTLKNYKHFRGCFAVSCEGKGEIEDTPQFVEFLTQLEKTKFPKN